MTRAKPTGTPHPFVADPDLPPHPADIEQRSVCRACHLVGQPGDAHHKMPDAPADVQRLAAGEREDG